MPSENEIKRIKKLHQKKYRYEFGQFIVEGKKSIQEAIDSGAHIVSIFATQAVRSELNTSGDINIETISDDEGNKMAATETFSGSLAVISIPEKIKFLDGPIVCLDKVSDPGNMGTIIRTADWFGIENILLSEDCADPYNPKVVRSTMGSLFHTNIMQSGNILKSLSQLEKKYQIVTLTMDGKDISNLKHNKHTVYVFGSESHGVRDEILKMGESYSISGKGKAESLNVSVSAGIVLNDIFRKYQESY